MNGFDKGLGGCICRSRIVGIRTGAVSWMRWVVFEENSDLGSLSIRIQA